MKYICWDEPFSDMSKYDCLVCTTEEAILDWIHKAYPNNKLSDEELIKDFMAMHSAYYKEIDI